MAVRRLRKGGGGGGGRSGRTAVGVPETSSPAPGHRPDLIVTDHQTKEPPSGPNSRGPTPGVVVGTGVVASQWVGAGQACIGRGGRGEGKERGNIQETAANSCVTFRRVVVPLRGPGQSPVLPFACCVGSLLSVGRCGRCSCWCRFRVRGALSLVCQGCTGCHPPPAFRMPNLCPASLTRSTSLNSICNRQ